MLRYLVVSYKLPKPDDVTLVDDTDEDPDNPRTQEENEQPHAVRNIHGTFKIR